MYIKRKLQPVIDSKLFKRKAIIISGARQVGKSTLMEKITESISASILRLNCDDPDIRNLLSDINNTNLRILIGSNNFIVIDEAQRVKNIGLVMKRIVDEFENVQILASGSSSLQLMSSINEPLTGRKYEYTLYPVSTGEIYETFGMITTRQWLERRLIYGSYPDILTHPEEAQELLKSLAESYLYKDILELEQIRKSAILQKLLIALALQVGSEVSFNEIGQTIGLDSKTVEKYVDLLEKCFVIYTLHGLRRNLRNELKKSKKIYFYDTGIRNAIIQNFTPIELRSDMGSIWENFFITERIKYNSYAGRNVNYYFWRTTAQQEIDFIEECNGEFSIFEMKWNPKKTNVKFPDSFIKTYQPKEMNVVTPDNYLEFLV